MKHFYIIYGTLITLAFLYAGIQRISLTDMFFSGSWSPQGRSAYHK